MLWAHERFDIGRPQLDSYANYGLREMYRSGVDDIDDRPTMGSLWTHREVFFVKFVYVIIMNTSSQTFLI